MFIQVDNQDYIIHLHNQLKSIEIHKIDGDIIHLNVPTSLHTDLLISYIKTNLRKEIQRYNNHSKALPSEFKLFDSSFNISYINSSSAYIKDKILYTNKKYINNKSNQQKLKDELLKNLINKQFAILEEDLNCQLPDIEIGFLKTHLYKFNKNSNSIKYNKSLVNQKHEYITYNVILSIFEYINRDTLSPESLLDKYVPNWKYIQKIIAHEQYYRSEISN